MKNWRRDSASRCRSPAARSRSRIPSKATGCTRRRARSRPPRPSISYRLRPWALASAPPYIRRSWPRRRRGIVDGAGPRRNTERLIDDRPEAFQIASRDRAADAFEVGGNFAPDVATVEIVQPRARKVLERCGKRVLFEHRTDIGHFVLEEECFLESGCLGHFG